MSPLPDAQVEKEPLAMFFIDEEPPPPLLDTSRDGSPGAKLHIAPPPPPAPKEVADEPDYFPINLKAPVKTFKAYLGRVASPKRLSIKAVAIASYYREAFGHRAKMPQKHRLKSLKRAKSCHFHVRE